MLEANNILKYFLPTKNTYTLVVATKGVQVGYHPVNLCIFLDYDIAYI
ncbi:MAG: hypothetical protein J6M30_04320 [Bacteroidales bacterium]|nr:hypothetical protein [Bacteroidales bacterium]